MFCTNCGTKIDDGCRFCVSCGQDIEQKVTDDRQKEEEHTITETLCSKCGMKLSDGVKFCIKCGAAVEIEASPQPVDPKPIPLRPWRRRRR